MVLAPAIANVSKVTFTWTAPDLRMNWTGTGDRYSLRYRDQVADDWTAVADVTDDTGITIPGLVAGTQYDFEVITHKDLPSLLAAAPPVHGSSLPAYYGWVIPTGLTVPTDCTVVSQSATQVTISWTGDATKEHIVKWLDNTGMARYMSVTGLTATITGLDANKSYVIYIAVTEGHEMVWGECFIDKNKECCTAVNNTSGEPGDVIVNNLVPVPDVTVENTVPVPVVNVTNTVTVPVATNVAVTGVDFNTTSITPVTVTGLTLAVEANKKYELRIMLKTACSGTAGLFMGINAPAGSSVVGGQWVFATTGIAVAGVTRVIAPGTVTTTAANRFAGAGSIHGNMVIQTGSTPGNVQAIIAAALGTETNTVSSTSYMTMKELT